MKLIDMKLPKPSKAETKKLSEACSPASDAYPWGLKLRFDDERVIEKIPILKKLGMDESVIITARANVTDLSSNEFKTEGGKTEERFSISLQIEQIAIAKTNDGQDAFDEDAGKKD